MTHFDTVLWDMDGTILDSQMLHYHAWRDLLAQRGFDYSFDQFRDGFGRSNHGVLTSLFPDMTAQEIGVISDEKERLFRRCLAQEGAQLLPGVRDWLDSLQQAGLLQIVSSSAPMANITAAVHALEIGDYFGALMSGARLPRSKPDPMLFVNSAAAAGVDAARCLVIEDTVHGVEAARRAGMACVVVGALADDPALDALLDAVPGPACVPVASLASTTPADLQARLVAA